MTFRKSLLDFCMFLALAVASILTVGCAGGKEAWSEEDGQALLNQVYDKEKRYI